MCAIDHTSGILEQTMKIITSHERTDMDALASMYAASLLYPDYEAVLPVQAQPQRARLRRALSSEELPFLDAPQAARIGASSAPAAWWIPRPSRRCAGWIAQTRIAIIDHHPLEQRPRADVSFCRASRGRHAPRCWWSSIRERGHCRSRPWAPA